jgi:hypothetical protein
MVYSPSWSRLLYHLLRYPHLARSVVLRSVGGEAKAGQDQC